MLSDAQHSSGPIESDSNIVYGYLASQSSLPSFCVSLSWGKVGFFGDSSPPLEGGRPKLHYFACVALLVRDDEINPPTPLRWGFKFGRPHQP
jgi:hypothetical protein